MCTDVERADFVCTDVERADLVCNKDRLEALLDTMYPLYMYVVYLTSYKRRHIISIVAASPT